MLSLVIALLLHIVDHGPHDGRDIVIVRLPQIHRLVQFQMHFNSNVLSTDLNASWNCVMVRKWTRQRVESATSKLKTLFFLVDCRIMSNIWVNKACIALQELVVTF